MSRFAFEAIDQTGMIVRGELEAPDQASVRDHLVLAGQTPVSIRAARTQSAFVQHGRRLFGIGAFNYVAVLHELGILLKAGLPVERALTTLKSLSLDAKSATRVQQIVERIRSGESFSQAFATLVPEAPPYIAGLLTAGEASGCLPETTQRVASGLARARALKSRVLSDLSYPALLMVTIGVVLWVIFHTVLPRLTPLFEHSDAEMPMPTRFLLATGVFFDTYGWLIALSLVGLLAGFVYSLKRPQTRLRLDRYVLTSRLGLGLPRSFEAAMFCRNLQTVLEGGLPLERALAAVKDGTPNRWLQREIAVVQNAVREGVRFSDALSNSARSLPPMAAEFAAVGEETGRLAAMMGEAADILEHTAQTRLTRVVALLVPIATLVMGALVAGIMTAIVSGILAISDLAR